MKNKTILLMSILLISCSSSERKEKFIDMSDYYGCYHQSHLGFYPEYYRNKPCTDYSKEIENRRNKEYSLKQTKDFSKSRYDSGTVPLESEVNSLKTEVIPYADPESKTTRELENEVVKKDDTYTEYTTEEVEEIPSEDEVYFEVPDDVFEEVVPTDN